MKNEWEKVTLGEVAFITDGDHLPPPKTEDGIPFIFISNIEGFNKINFTDCSYVPESYYDKIIDKRRVKENDILYSVVGSYGIPVLIKGRKKFCFQRHIALIRAEKINPDFLVQALDSSGFHLQADKIAIGEAQKTITLENLRKMKINLPPISEQVKIAETLSLWDSAIQKTEKLISEKEKLFNGISQKIFRKASIKHKISEFLTIRNEKCIPDDSTPLYSLTIENGITPKSDRYDREALVKDSEEKEYKVVYPGDIVFNPANLRWGAIARSNETKRVAVSPIYEVLQLDSSKINSDYLTFLLTSKDKIRYYATKTEGTLVERMAVKVDVFLNFQIEIEEDNENQKTVSEVLTTLIREISLLKKQLEQYKLQKQGLMQKLLTGEWRVR